MTTSETDWKVAARESWIFQLALRTPSANERRERGEDDAAQREQLGAGRAGEIGDGVEVEVVGPHRRQRDHREAQRRARAGRGLAVEIVDEDQRAGGDDRGR